MRSRIVVLSSFLLFLCSFAFAKDVFLSIGGSVNNFRTDTRILNPSDSKDITLQATFLPAGNVDNRAVQPKTITIPKRQMVVYDDVVSSLFNASGLGAVRLTSADDFVATQRIYAVVSAGTTGQFVPGLEISHALTKGVLIQLKSNGSTAGTFRTNIGFVNPNATATTVSLYLYDKSNALIGQPVTVAMQPLGVIVPTHVNLLFPAAASANLSDAWVAFTATQPIFSYASVIDNGTTDPTFIPASEDSGNVSSVPAQVTVDVGPGLSFTPSSVTIKVGDTVKWVFHGFHTTTSDDPNGVENWDSGPMSSGTFSHTFETAGDWPYYCTLHSSPGGSGMNGVVHVTQRTPPGY